MGPCKTKRSQRSVVLPESVVKLLAKYKGERPPTKSDLFFISLRGAPWTTHGFKASWCLVRSRAAGMMGPRCRGAPLPVPPRRRGMGYSAAASTTCATPTRPSCSAPAFTSRWSLSASATTRRRLCGPTPTCCRTCRSSGRGDRADASGAASGADQLSPRSHRAQVGK